MGAKVRHNRGKWAQSHVHNMRHPAPETAQKKSEKRRSVRDVSGSSGVSPAIRRPRPHDIPNPADGAGWDTCANLHGRRHRISMPPALPRWTRSRPWSSRCRLGQQIEEIVLSSDPRLQYLAGRPPNFLAEIDRAYGIAASDSRAAARRHRALGIGFIETRSRSNGTRRLVSWRVLEMGPAIFSGSFSEPVRIKRIPRRAQVDQD